MSDGPQYPTYPGQDPDEGRPATPPPTPPSGQPQPDPSQPAYGSPSSSPPPPAYGEAPPPPGWAGPGAGASYASWGARLGAYLLDSLIAFGVMLPFFIVSIAIAGATGEAGEFNPDTGLYEGDTVSPLSAVFLGLAYLAYFVFLIWNFGMRQGRTGQTVGKRIVNIRVVREAGGDVPLGFWLSIGRTLLFSIITTCTLYINALWPLWDSKRQALHDKVVNTVVIRA